MTHESPARDAVAKDRADREAIARIIDPDVMSDVECEKLGIKEVFRPVLREKLLAKADAILSLLARTEAPAGEVERLREAQACELIEKISDPCVGYKESIRLLTAALAQPVQESKV